MKIHGLAQTKSRVNPWSYAFVALTALTGGMLLASWYYPDTPEPMGRLMICLTCSAIAAGIMAIVEAPR